MNWPHEARVADDAVEETAESWVRIPARANCANRTGSIFAWAQALFCFSRSNQLYVENRFNLAQNSSNTGKIGMIILLPHINLFGIVGLVSKNSRK
jgi:hypothetical protein